MANWGRLSTVEAIALLRSAGLKKSGPHSMKKRVLHWPYCSNCGLVALKNDVTRTALRRACTWEE